MSTASLNCATPATSSSPPKTVSPFTSKSFSTIALSLKVALPTTSKVPSRRVALSTLRLPPITAPPVTPRLPPITAPPSA